jgi:tRNA (mo5U34)-methyltransferase
MTLQSRSTHDAEIGALAPWFHNLHLPDGRRTAPDHPLGDFPAYKWKAIAPSLPADLTGWSALDIGCNAGFYSFELARRGARVTGVDLDERYLRQARWAGARLGLDDRVDFRAGTVYDLAATDDQWDLVLFMGVLYHLRYPLLALDVISERVRGRLILQTLTMPGGAPITPPDDVALGERERLTEPGWARAAFIERHMAGDPTNWWVPDDACVRALVRSAGQRVVAAPAHEFYICEPDPEHDHARYFRRAELGAILAQHSSSRKRK